MIFEVVTDLGVVVFSSISLDSCRLFCRKNDFSYDSIREVGADYDLRSLCDA